MIGQSLIFVCATIALVSGACFDTPISQEISAPVISTGYVSAVPSPVISTKYVSPVSSPVTPLSLGSSVLSSGLGAGSFLLSSGLEAQITNGPQYTPVTVAQAPLVTLPPVEGPVVTLSSQPIPAPRVISGKCVCTKTIVKPQVFQRTVTVPKIQRYLKRTVTPVVENVAFKSVSITQASSFGSGVISFGISSAPAVLSCGSSSSPVVISSGISSSAVVISSGISSSVAGLESCAPAPVIASSGLSGSSLPISSCSC